jgi:glycosyltransferase involved in cell wall biosynthesis
LAKDYPLVSVNIAVYNEERNIRRCLDSLIKQDYPKDSLEVLIIDGGSKDRTLEIAKEYHVRIIHNERKTCPAGRYLGFQKATGDLHTYIDADMELCETDWLSRMVRPLIENLKVVASFPEYRVDSTDPPLTRYFQHHQVWHPYLEFISPGVHSTVENSTRTYSVCRFKKGKMPYVPITVFRMNVLRELLKDKGPNWEWIDTEISLLAIQRNYETFAYVPVGLFHHTYPTLRSYSSKIKRDVSESYLRTMDKRETTYINPRSPISIIQLALWAMYVNALVPETFRALIDAAANRDWVMLYRPLVSVLSIDLPTMFALSSLGGVRDLLRK